jgi:hypothetical protein
LDADLDRLVGRSIGRNLDHPVVGSHHFVDEKRGGSVMKPFFILVAVVLVTTLGMAALTEFDGTGNSTARIFGVPLVSVMQDGARGIIALGQADAVGMLVIAQGGMGLVAFCQVGIGLLFFLGQAGAGLFAVAQVGIGLFFVAGLFGAGIQAAGLVVFYSRVGAYFDEMNKEFGELLSFRGPSIEKYPPFAESASARTSVSKKQRRGKKGNSRTRRSLNAFSIR